MKVDNPYTIFVHCVCHRLNLAFSQVKIELHSNKVALQYSTQYLLDNRIKWFANYICLHCAPQFPVWHSLPLTEIWVCFLLVWQLHYFIICIGNALHLYKWWWHWHMLCMSFIFSFRVSGVSASSRHGNPAGAYFQRLLITAVRCSTGRMTALLYSLSWQC